MGIILRRDKGSALTHNEMDDNLVYLENSAGGAIAEETVTLTTGEHKEFYLSKPSTSPTVSVLKKGTIYKNNTFLEVKKNDTSFTSPNYGKDYYTHGSDSDNIYYNGYSHHLVSQNNYFTTDWVGMYLYFGKAPSFTGKAIVTGFVSTSELEVVIIEPIDSNPSYNTQYPYDHTQGLAIESVVREKDFLTIPYWETNITPTDGAITTVPNQPDSGTSFVNDSLVFMGTDATASIYDNTQTLVTSHTFGSDTKTSTGATTLSNGNALLVYANASGLNIAIMDSIGTIIKDETLISTNLVESKRSIDCASLFKEGAFIVFIGAGSKPSLIMVDNDGNIIKEETVFSTYAVININCVSLSNSHLFVTYSASREARATTFDENGKILISDSVALASMSTSINTDDAYNLSCAKFYNDKILIAFFYNDVVGYKIYNESQQILVDTKSAPYTTYANIMTASGGTSVLLIRGNSSLYAVADDGNLTTIASGVNAYIPFFRGFETLKHNSVVAYNQSGTYKYYFYTNGILRSNGTTMWSLTLSNISDSSEFISLVSFNPFEIKKGQSIFYVFTTDDITWKIMDETNGVRNIARNNTSVWEYNTNTTYSSETWVSAPLNTNTDALINAMGTTINQMDGTQLKAVVTPSSIIPIGSILRMAVFMKSSDANIIPYFEGVDVVAYQNGYVSTVIGVDFEYTQWDKSIISFVPLIDNTFKVRIS